MKRKELNHHYFNEARKSYKELYERSKSGLNFKNLKKLILRKDNFIVALRELSYNAGRETPGLNGTNEYKNLELLCDECHLVLTNQGQ